MIKLKYVVLWLCFFTVYAVTEYFVFTQDKTTRKYRTTVRTILDRDLNMFTLENINNIHGNPSGVLNILYSFQYNTNILDASVQTQQGKKRVKDYIIQTVDKKELDALSKNYYTDFYSEEERKRQIAFMLLQGRLYFTFDKIVEKFHTYIHFVHSDTTFAREYIMLNINKYNEIISNRRVLVFRDKFAMINKDFNEAKAKIENILTEIAIHHDTRRKLVKEAGGVDLIKHKRAMDIEEDLLYRKKQSAGLVYLLSAGDVKQLIVIGEPTFKDNTAHEYIIRNYILITSAIYSFMTIACINFVVRKRKIFKDWLAKQNIS
jgi:hypothetical protein